ncbi:carbohydrate-binding protein SusD [Niabella ginsenosidivorans]|uniref:Carbohydrate-binding protein SusD n=1 Tax=Niabella ginsenosidivorans TaxID=1176587 RepID=A0A1A9I863_9BACT|nr:RagB/SusD family nutrient uptake outer membrane protein [Niabella ginsenosidivorans]ANH82852.1 carbohydrate-binding protein SusD [Niabella ginsenosidivorans]
MKNLLNILLFFTGAVLLLCSCNKGYLEQPPRDRLDADQFFNTATDLEVYTNDFYDMLPDYHLYDATYGLSASDDVVSLIEPAQITGTRLVPVQRGSGGWTWSDLRAINFFLQNYQKCPDEAARHKYGSIARFFRAFFYFDKVKMFGDVPWYNKVLEAGDADLYKARDPRTVVMDSVLADINDAVEYLPAEVQLNRITKYTALLLKARICLYEGTFRKYHTELNLQGSANKWLQDAADAAGQLISSHAYKLFTTGGTDAAYRTLFARNDQDATETILARDYNPTFAHHTLSYLMTSPTQGSWGATKDFVNGFLMADGSRFTDIAGYDTLGFYGEMQHRDPRLTQIVAGPDFKVYGETIVEPVNLNITTTGYRVIKALATRDQWGASSAYNDIILFRYAEALLIDAEAKAELGTLTQTDLDNTINQLRSRAGMPPANLAHDNADPDAYLGAEYANVTGANKGILLEIRRERRIEMFNEGQRWDDLMRWKNGKKLEQPMLGIYFPRLGAFDFNNDGKPDVYLYDGDASGAPAGVTSKINIRQRPLTNGTSGNFYPYRNKILFQEPKDYYYPIPLEDLTLNKSLVQNPGW